MENKVEVELVDYEESEEEDFQSKREWVSSPYTRQLLIQREKFLQRAEENLRRYCECSSDPRVQGAYFQMAEIERTISMLRGA